MLGNDAGSQQDDARILERLMELPQRLRAAPSVGPMSQFATMACLVGTFRSGVHMDIQSGQITAIQPGPVLMKSWDFAFRATPEAWEAHWQTLPRAGFHDILALTKRGHATVEGDLRPFLANLQFFKDLLALPRANNQRVAA